MATGTLYDLSDLTCPLIALPALPEIECGAKFNGNISREDEMSFQVNKLLDSLPEPTYDANAANQCRSVDILSNQWPERNLFGLDESQFAALKAAITKQLTIIQGPPGIYPIASPSEISEQQIGIETRRKQRLLTVTVAYS